ncbi:MAG: EamA family transporter, partial [Chromatiales bacterium]|nr:EamA family transporter [Chromatiales bacterium]
SWVWDSEPRYLMALLYLSIIASIIGFSTYLMLVARIGANSAAYTLVTTPVVALGLSTLFEGYQWTITGFLGLALILVGNIIILGNIHTKLIRFIPAYNRS